MIDRRHVLIAALATAALPVSAASISAHDFTFQDIDGNALPLSRFAGKPLMVVNTASRCGFTYQYDGLQALYDRYRDRGFVVLAVPSDDFGGQELADEAAVKHFCAVNFNLDLPMTSITKVKGRNAHPFYAWAREELGASKSPRWNFHKYLVDAEGGLVGAFPTRLDPESQKVRRAVEALLDAADA